MIIPSIDLMDGKAVQLRQGKELVLERTDVLELAKEFSIYGEIAVIDLDAALGKGNNTELIRSICKIADCRVGGGIRTIEKAKEILDFGAKKIIIGTKAKKDFLQKLPKEKILVAIDTKNGYVTDKGWTNSTSKKPEEVILELEDYCGGFLFTDVGREGMMQGIDIQKALTLKASTKKDITFAGGITTVEDIMFLEKNRISSQIGMSLYTGKINLDEALTSILDFNKCDGLIPTIVQDESGDVLMLAFSNKDSIKETFRTKKATYYSRTRKRLWTKGETSGNYQELLKIRNDCDKDSLLFTVRQNNFCCHEGTYSCFRDERFDLQKLYRTICERRDNPKENSYTSSIVNDEDMIMEKIDEESGEVINYTSRENLVWEIADLAYFLLVLMANKKIEPDEVITELKRRTGQ